MKFQKLFSSLFLSIIVLICTACTTEISMPYSSKEYQELQWSVEELISHFEELGFSNIKTDITETFDKDQARICRVAIEDIFADSWFTEYKNFEKNETYSAYLEVYISAYVLTPTLTIENCSEFAELITLDEKTIENKDLLSSFMKSHNGDYIEFSGTITDWYDELWYLSVDLTVSVENSEHLSFSWNTCNYSDLGLAGKYDINKYYLGLIKEGMPVHIIARINYTEDNWHLKIDSMQIIE